MLQLSKDIYTHILISKESENLLWPENLSAVDGQCWQQDLKHVTWLKSAVHNQNIKQLKIIIKRGKVYEKDSSRSTFKTDGCFWEYVCWIVKLKLSIHQH